MPTDPNISLHGLRDDRRNCHALGYMTIAVICFSFIPLVVDLGGGDEKPFLFNVGFRCGLLVGWLVFLLCIYLPMLVDRRVWRGIWDLVHLEMRLISRFKFRQFSLTWVLIGQFQLGLFALSIRFVDISIMAILYETWPIFMVILTANIFRGTDRYRNLNSEMIALFVTGFLGIILVGISQEGTLPGSMEWSALFPGTVLVFLTILLASLSSYSFKWGVDLENSLPQYVRGGRDEDSVQLFGVVMASLLASLLSTPILLTAGIANQETIELSDFTTAFVGGIGTLAIGNILWRKANVISTNLGINALSYLTPALSLGLLFFFSKVSVARFDLLIIGSAAIIAANLLIHFEAEVRLGFKALVLALVACGAIVYLRDEVFSYFSINWSWVASGYFESITLAATVFTLLLAFRVSRLVSRTSEEDGRTFLIYRKLDQLARRGIISPQVCKYVLDIDRANNNSAAEKLAYERARSLIEDVDRPILNEADSQLLSDAESQLDALARSKQVDIHLGEQFALWIFGGITIGLALFSLPSNVAIGWTRLLVDLFAMLISTVVLFLLFHILDLQRERDQQKFENSLTTYGGNLKALVRFFDTKQRSADKWVSLCVGGSLIAIYAIILYYKWLSQHI